MMLCIVILLCACGPRPRKNSEETVTEKTTKPVILEEGLDTAPVHDTGAFSVAIPDGWVGMDTMDPLTGSEEIRTDRYTLIKGKPKAKDIDTKPSVSILYYPEHSLDSQYDFIAATVDEIRKVPFTTNGTECLAMETKTPHWSNPDTIIKEYFIYVPSGDGCFEIKFDGNKLTMDDPDLQKIADSLKTND